MEFLGPMRRCSLNHTNIRPFEHLTHVMPNLCAYHLGLVFGLLESERGLVVAGGGVVFERGDIVIPAPKRIRPLDTSIGTYTLSIPFMTYLHTSDETLRQGIL